jgi:hypothetical protein
LKVVFDALAASERGDPVPLAELVREYPELMPRQHPLPGVTRPEKLMMGVAVPGGCKPEQHVHPHPGRDPRSLHHVVQAIGEAVYWWHRDDAHARVFKAAYEHLPRRRPPARDLARAAWEAVEHVCSERKCSRSAARQIVWELVRRYCYDAPRIDEGSGKLAHCVRPEIPAYLLPLVMRMGENQPKALADWVSCQSTLPLPEAAPPLQSGGLQDPTETVLAQPAPKSPDGTEADPSSDATALYQQVRLERVEGRMLRLLRKYDEVQRQRGAFLAALGVDGFEVRLRLSSDKDFVLGGVANQLPSTRQELTFVTAVPGTHPFGERGGDNRPARIFQEPKEGTPGTAPTGEGGLPRRGRKRRS